MALELRLVGHREAGAVDDPDAEPEPACALGGGPHRGGGSFHKPVVHGQWDPLARQAVGTVGKGPAAEVNDMLASRVAVEDLQPDEVDGRCRVEDPLAAAMLGLATSLFDGLSGQSGSKVVAQPIKDGNDARWHEWGSVQQMWVLVLPTACREHLSCLKIKHRIQLVLTSWHSTMSPSFVAMSPSFVVSPSFVARHHRRQAKET